jgi:nucleotide-binding universal stress UspA family protein
MSIEIVLAIRIGPSSAAPTRVAKELAQQLGANITALYIATEVHAHEVGAAEAGADPGSEMERVLRTADAELRAFVAEHFADMPVRIEIVQGKVEEQVARYASDVGASYIVVGTKGRGGLARLVLGDTTHGILQHTPCPVIVVPLRDESTRS